MHHTGNKNKIIKSSKISMVQLKREYLISLGYMNMLTEYFGQTLSQTHHTYSIT